MSSEPIVSVIVPYRNEAAYLRTCLEALTRQDVDPASYELILVDNGSTDSSRCIVGDFAQVISLREERPGPYAARNCGLRKARGRLILFTDADCRVASDWVRQMQLALTEADVALGGRHFPPGPWLSIISDFENARAAHLIAAGRRNSIFGYTNNMGVRRERFQQVGLFTPLIRGGDTEFLNRCLCSAPHSRVVFAPQARIEHLEIHTAGHWLKHLYDYGRAHGQILQSSGYEPAGWLTVLGIGWSQARGYGFGPRCLPLLAYLVLGKLCFLGGRLADLAGPGTWK